MVYTESVYEGSVKLYNSPTKGQYFIRKSRRVYLNECIPFTDKQGVTVYQWSEVGLHFEATVHEGYVKKYWIIRWRE